MAREVRVNRHPFAPIWTGPHTVPDKVSREVYRFIRDGKQTTLHVDTLRPAPDEAQVWWSSDSDTDGDGSTSSDPPATPVATQNANARSKAMAHRAPPGDNSDSPDTSTDDETTAVQRRAETTVAIVHRQPEATDDEDLTCSTADTSYLGPSATFSQAHLPPSTPIPMEGRPVAVDIQAPEPLITQAPEPLICNSPPDAGSSEDVSYGSPEQSSPVHLTSATPPTSTHASVGSSGPDLHVFPVPEQRFISPPRDDISPAAAPAVYHKTVSQAISNTPTPGPPIIQLGDSIITAPIPEPISDASHSNFLPVPATEPPANILPADSPTSATSKAEYTTAGTRPASHEITTSRRSHKQPADGDQSRGDPPRSPATPDIIVPESAPAEISSAPPVGSAHPNLVPAGRIPPRRRRRARLIICNEGQCSVVFRECA